MLKGVHIEQGWGGMLGVPRSWAPAVSFDAGSGLGCAGGYVGDGVAASNLAARSLVDLMLDRDTELTDLPWIDGKHPRWEPEPLRWLGYSVARLCGEAADNFELREQRHAGISGYLYKLIWG